MNILSKFWWLALLRGLVLILLAFLVFRHPMNALVGVAIYIGITLIFTGITEIITAIFVRSNTPSWGWELAGGMIDLLFGVVLLSNPALSAATLPFVVGFWLIVCGVIIFVGSSQSKRDGSPFWWLGLVVGILALVVGYVITNNLLAGIFALTYWMGIGFLLAGIANISTAFSLKKAFHEFV